MVQTHPGDAGAGFVGDQLKVIGLATHDAAQGDQGIKVIALGQGLQSQRHFQRARHLHRLDVLGFYLVGLQLGHTGLVQRIGDVGIEAGLHNADAQACTIELRSLGWVLWGEHGRSKGSGQALSPGIR